MAANVRYWWTGSAPVVFSALSWLCACNTGTPTDSPGAGSAGTEVSAHAAGASGEDSPPATGSAAGNRSGGAAGSTRQVSTGSSGADNATGGNQAGGTSGKPSDEENSGSSATGGNRNGSTGPRDAGGRTTGSAGDPASSTAGNPIVDAGATPVEPRDPVASTGCGAAEAPAGVGANTTYNIDVNGTSRKYIVGVPANYDPNHPYRLIFAWHGLGGTAEQTAGTSRGGFGYYGLQSLSENSTIFVAGQGLDVGNDGGAGWPDTSGRDIAFVRAMLEWIQPKYCIDKARIFSVGMSYGGIMSNNIGCKLGDTFRAIAPASGMGPGGFGRSQATCTGQVAAWIAHGTQDTTVPYDSGVASLNYWRTANHCGTSTTPASVAPCVDYEGCDPGYPVTFCAFDGGHTIPKFEAQAIWDFLKQF